MDNSILTTEVAADARGLLGMGAGFVRSGETHFGFAAVMAIPRLRRSGLPVASGVGGGTAGVCPASWKQPVIKAQISQKYAQTTRAAAANGGALGSHPARDPV